MVLETFKEVEALIEGRERRENASDPSLTSRSGHKPRHLRFRRGVRLVERGSRGAPSFANSYVQVVVPGLVINAISQREWAKVYEKRLNKLGGV